MRTYKEKIFYVMFLPEKCSGFFYSFCRKSLKMSKSAVGRRPLSHIQFNCKWTRDQIGASSLACDYYQSELRHTEQPSALSFSHLHVLQKGSNTEERDLDWSIELGLCCVQQLFKGRRRPLMIFSPLLLLIYTGILQQRNNTNTTLFRDVPSTDQDHIVPCIQSKMYFIIAIFWWNQQTTQNLGYSCC